MLVHGVGKPLPKKNNDKFDSTVAENEKLLNTLLRRKEAKNAYTTINTNTVTSITLDTHPTFLFLKSEIENFNEEVRSSLQAKTTIPDYSWKFSLLLGLRNLLKETVSTEDKNLKEAFLERAKQWYFEKLQKKGALPEQKESSRPDTANLSLRPITAGTRPFTALTRPFTSGTNPLSDLNRTSVNASLIPPEGESRGGGKSFFTDTRDDILPSRLKADILKDYEEGARSRHDIVEPPYERLSEYERKIPQGILKPISRSGHRPQTSKTTTFANNANKDKDLRFFMDKTGGAIGGGLNSEDRELSQAEFSQLGEEGAEGNEGEAAPAKAGIVVPARRLYLNDKLTALEQNVKDINIPMEQRSNYAHYAPSDAVTEARLEQRWRNAMHKKVKESREKEEFVTRMTQWSHSKSRLEEEIARRNESNTYGSQFKKRTFVPRAKSANVGSSLPRRFGSQVKEADEEEEDAEGEEEAEEQEGEEDLDIRDEDEISEKSEGQEIDNSPDGLKKMGFPKENGSKRFGRPEFHDYSKIRPRSVATGQQIEVIKTEPMEDKMNKLAIDRITKLHGDLLFGARNVPVDVGQDGAYSHERPTSLSIYDHSAMPKYRPFSAVYQSAKPENFRKAQMEEVEEIKAKLAKYKIKMPAKQIKASILLPELGPSGNTKLPSPGAGLFVNPFYKEKKKGKKKGGKKKKK